MSWARVRQNLAIKFEILFCWQRASKEYDNRMEAESRNGILKKLPATEIVRPKTMKVRKKTMPPMTFSMRI
jgi:hypothetical protein